MAAWSLSHATLNMLTQPEKSISVIYQSLFPTYLRLGRNVVFALTEPGDMGSKMDPDGLTEITD